MPSESIALVGSGLKMRSHTCQAKYMFRSTLFDLRVEWAETAHKYVRVVSPYHTKPMELGQWVRPVPERNWNEHQLRRWSRDGGRHWANDLILILRDDFQEVFDDDGYIVLYTCKEVTNVLLPLLAFCRISHRVPLEGMNGGEQCHWLLKQIDGSLRPRR